MVPATGTYLLRIIGRRPQTWHLGSPAQRAHVADWVPDPADSTCLPITRNTNTECSSADPWHLLSMTFGVRPDQLFTWNPGTWKSYIFQHGGLGGPRDDPPNALVAHVL
jgi:hypothetical protein